MPSHETDLLGSDRLRRAIERNKAKQAQRASMRGSPQRARVFKSSELRGTRGEENVPARTQEAPQVREEQTSFRSRLASRITANPPSVSTPPSPSRPSSPASSRVPMQNFVRPGMAPSPSASPAATIITERKRPPVFLNKLWEIVLKGMWLFCGVLIFRLIFTTGGVVDYYTKQDHFHMKDREYRSIGQENKELLQEIDKITNSPVYQKKLVRTYLEFIGHDEFLILFARKEGGKSL